MLELSEILLLILLFSTSYALFSRHRRVPCPSDRVEIVFVYTDSCPHCTRLKPIFERALRGSTTRHSTRDAHASTEFCRANGIDRVPSIVAVVDGAVTRTFRGPGTVAAIRAFAAER